MGRRIAAFLLFVGALGLQVQPSLADVVITLGPFLENGQPVAGPVALGTDVVVDVLLSVDAEDDPLPHVRMIQFDFEATSPLIQLVAFTWTVDANAYSFQDPEFPQTNVTSIYFEPGPGLLTLTTDPVKVASVDITIDGAGTLDVVNPDNTDPNFGADIRARFDGGPGTYSDLLGNLRGGSHTFSATSNGGGDNGGGGGGVGGGVPTPQDHDGDGVPNDNDAFPDDPDEDTDTNNDGVGDNADSDDDGDGVVDDDDDFPEDPDEVTDNDGDGTGDSEDADLDGDNVANDSDAFPLDPAESLDSDDDGAGNNADTDDDNDGIEDGEDGAPLDPDVGGEGDGSDGGAVGGGAPRMCGAGMLGSSMIMLLGLGLMAYRPGRRI
jgi:hypothetical protein